MLGTVTACGGTVEPEIEYRPVLLPVKFTVGPDGVDVSGETRLVTPIGEFTIAAKKPLSDRPPGSVHVIIRDRNRGRAGTDQVFLVRAGGDSIKVVVDGHTEIEVRDRQVVIDVTRGDIKGIQLARMEPVGASADDNAIHAWWTEADHRWDAGWAESIYHPFMLTRWAYDDSTISRWYGLGFFWFLLRLFLAVLLLLVDLVLTAIFLIAQVAFYFWGATGRNIIWGIVILVVLGFVGMFLMMLRE